MYWYDNKIYIYQSGIQNLHMKEGQIMQRQMKKEKKTGNDLLSTTYNSKD